MICKHETYANDEGHVVQAKVPISTFERSQFFGVGIHQIDAEHAAHFEFEVQGENIEEAFANWQAAHDAKLAIVKAEIAADKRKAALPLIQRATSIPQMATRRG